MMEDFYGEEINLDKHKVKIAGTNEIVNTDKEKSILATNSISTCVAMLLICEEEAYMFHMLTQNDEDYKLGLSKAKELIKNTNSKINELLLFYGEKTERDRIDNLKSIFNTNNLYKAYIEFGGCGGIAYDFSTKQFYGFDGDFNFYEYKFGFDNRSAIFGLNNTR